MLEDVAICLSLVQHKGSVVIKSINLNSVIHLFYNSIYMFKLTFNSAYKTKNLTLILYIR